MKLLVFLIVLVTVAKGDDGVTREEMSRVLSGFIRDITRQMRTMEETMAAEVKILKTEMARIQKSCQV